MSHHFKNSQDSHQPEYANQFSRLPNYLQVLKLLQQQSKVEGRNGNKVHKILWIRYESKSNRTRSTLMSHKIINVLPVLVRTEHNPQSKLNCEEQDTSNVNIFQDLHDQ